MKLNSGENVAPIVFAIWLHALTLVFLWARGLNMVVYEGAYLCSVFPVLLLFIRAWGEIKVPSVLFLLLPFVYLLVVSASNLFGLPTENWYAYLLNIYWLFVLSFLVTLAHEGVFFKTVRFYGLIGIPYLLITVLDIVSKSGLAELGLHHNYIAMGCLGIFVSVLATVESKLLVSAAVLLAIVIGILLISRAAILCSLLALGIRYVFWGLKGTERKNLFNQVARKALKALWIILLAVVIIFITTGDLIIELLALDSSYRGVGSGLSGRTDRWLVALSYIFDRPWLGYGYGQANQTIGFSIDNAYLTVAFEVGLVGLLLYVAWILIGLCKSINLKGLADDRNARISFMVLITYCVYGMFERRHFNAGNPFSIIFCFSMFYSLKCSSIRYGRPIAAEDG